jgi:hypothetical protein
MIDHAAIFRVACALRPYYDRQAKLFDELFNDPDSDVVKKNAEWIKACEVYAALLLEHAPAIAFATRNSAENIRLLFQSHVGVTFIPWTPQDLLQVARYESFNRRFWDSNNLVVKNEYEFPQ